MPPVYVRICGYGQIYLFVYTTLIYACLCEWVSELSHAQLSCELHAEAWETVEHQAYNMTVCVVCEVWTEAEKTAQSIAQQPDGSSLMRLMCVWSRNKERDQAACCMMGMWVCIYIYVCVYIQGVTGGTDQTSGECSLC